jgi:hypothetical protein
MNLVKLITDQISSDTLAMLSSILGVDSETVESAISVAVPSMLAGLGGLASQEEGIRKLSGTLGSLDDTMFGNFDRLLGGDTGAVLQKGSGLLEGLFGNGVTNNLATAVSRFTGLDPGTVKSLLAMLTPLVLGRVASQWRNQGGTPGALKTLFVDQRRSIEDALPSGFALGDVPGLPRMGDVRNAATAATASSSRAPKSLASTLLPLALLIAAALLLWSYWNNRQQPQEAGVKPTLNKTESVVVMKPVSPEAPVVPTATEMKQELTGLFESLDTTFAEIKDGATAEAALPQLNELNRRIDVLNAETRGVPAPTWTALGGFLNEQIEAAKAQSTRVLSLPGMPQQLQKIVTEIIRKLENLQSAQARP